MRRRPQRSPQNHALVASVAGVILLCGVVSVQTTQASQAFSHEQGMARMAGVSHEHGATTASDATWWSFWRAVRTLLLARSCLCRGGRAPRTCSGSRAPPCH